MNPTPLAPQYTVTLSPSVHNTSAVHVHAGIWCEAAVCADEEMYRSIGEEVKRSSTAEAFGYSNTGSIWEVSEAESGGKGGESFGSESSWGGTVSSESAREQFAEEGAADEVLKYMLNSVLRVKAKYENEGSYDEKVMAAFVTDSIPNAVPIGLSETRLLTECEAFDDQFVGSRAAHSPKPIYRGLSSHEIAAKEYDDKHRNLADSMFGTRWERVANTVGKDLAYYCKSGEGWRKVVGFVDENRDIVMAWLWAYGSYERRR